MRRMLLLATVAVMLAAMMATAGPASATVHRLTCGDEKAQETLNGTPSPVVDVMDVPGITDSANETPVVDNGRNAPEGQPVLSVQDDDNNAGPNDEAQENAIVKKNAGDNCVPSS